MSAFFETSPMIVRSISRDPQQMTSEVAYDVVDHEGRHLAHAYRDLGEGGGQRFLRDFAESMANSTRYVVQDEVQRPMLALGEWRGRRSTTISVSWASGTAVGSLTMERWQGTARCYRLSDAEGRQWAQVVRHDPRPGKGVLGRLLTMDPLEDRFYTATDHHGQEIARITDTKRRDTSHGYEKHVSDHVLELRYSQLPEPLSTLLRTTTIALDFAAFTEH